MTGKIVKYGHSEDAPGEYQLRGGLAGIVGPGRRKVRILRCATPLTPENCPDGLEVLRAFPDLEWLEILGLEGLDTSVLGELGLRFLRLTGVEDTDLRWLTGDGCPTETLWVEGARRVQLPDSLVLPSTLRELLWKRVAAVDGECALPLLLERSNLRELRDLKLLRIGARYEREGPALVEVELLRCFPKLEVLDGENVVLVRDGVPVLPPFPEAAPGVDVYPGFQDFMQERWLNRSSREAASDEDPVELVGDRWIVDVSFAELLGDDETREASALRQARTRLREADPELLRRLDFDQEADGTMISAADRADIDRIFEVLEIPLPWEPAGE